MLDLIAKYKLSISFGVLPDNKTREVRVGSFWDPYESRFVPVTEKLGSNPELSLKKAIKRAVIIIENKLEGRPSYIDKKR